MSARRDDRAHWDARYAGGVRDAAPSAWVVRHAAGVPVGARCLDLACGAGRHAALLVGVQRTVVALDFVERIVRLAARTRGVIGLVADAGDLPLRPRSFDCIVCVNFLDRSLFPTVIALLGPGGRLIYETFTRQNLGVPPDRRHGPSNPAYLLAAGELRRLVAPLDIIAAYEGAVRDDAGERYVASVVAVNASRAAGVQAAPLGSRLRDP